MVIMVVMVTLWSCSGTAKKTVKQEIVRELSQWGNTRSSMS